MLACLVQAVGDFGYELCHLKSCFLAGTLLVQEFEHLSYERLAHDELHTNLAVLFLEELLLDNKFSKLSMLSLRFFFLLSAPDEQTEFVFGCQAG